MNVPNNYHCPVIKTYGRWRAACARAEWHVWYRSSAAIMLRKAIWEKKNFAKVAKIIRLSLNSKTNSPKLWNNVLTCLCLLRFVEATKLRESSEFSNCVQNVWQRVASLVKLYVNLKNFCTARKRSRYEFSGTVLCRTCLSGRKRLSIHSFYSLIYSHPTQQDCVLPVSTPWTNNNTNYCQYLSLAESWYTNVELLYLSVSTRGVIGQFSGPYSTVRPAKFMQNARVIINILLTSFSLSVL